MKFRFLKILLFIGVVVIFIKIYQHNRVVKINYEKQRLERKLDELVKEKNELMVEYSLLRNYKKVKEDVLQDLNMQKISLSKVITFTAV